MKIISYNKLTLLDALNTGELFETDYYPITHHRAISHINNPHLVDNDVILIVAKKEKSLVGYLGILPQLLSLNGENKKVGILTTWWVNPSMRGKSTGFGFLQEALKVYNKNLFAMDFSKHAQKIFNYFPIFKKLNTQKKTVLSFNYIQKNTTIRKISSYLLSLYLDASTKLWTSLNDKTLKNVLVEYTNNLNKYDQTVLKEIIEKSLFKRTTNDLNWIIKFPWVLESSKVEDRYYFSSFSNTFKTMFLKISSKDKNLLAVFMIKKRNKNVSIPYQYVLKNRELVYKVLLNELLKLKFDTLTFMDEKLNKKLSSLLPSYIFYNKKCSNKIILTTDKAVYSNQSQKRIYLGDGDSVFT